jgi:NAD(P)-dependent dehydrogenase (short-subunit alcohol dehydrogenase family)
MSNVCVITGGGSGMGLAAAKMIGKEYHIVISGRTVEKLKSAVSELKDLGIKAEACACDVSDRASVKNLAAQASTAGDVKVLIHAAGISPSMSSEAAIMSINALGTINVNEAFSDVMSTGGRIINVSSMAAYMMPSILLPTGAYKLSKTNVDLFIKKMMGRVNLFPKKQRPGIAYVISKNFVIWYTKTEAVRMAAKGLRILSVSPGIFDTPMGQLERDEGAKLLATSAIKRFGRTDEIAELLAFLASDKCSYLTGVDILCDGGVIASRVKK